MAAYVGKIHEWISTAKEAADSRCLYFDRDGNRCRNDSIESHSLQRNGPLASIAEDGHVIRISHALRAQKFEDRRFFEKVGVRKASTFQGFCNKHDSEIFSEIEERDVQLTERNAVLFAIRSFAFEHYQKGVMVELQKSLIRDSLENGDLEKVKFAGWVLEGASRARTAGESRLRAFFKFHFRQAPPNYLYCLTQYAHEAPFAVTGAFEPEWNLSGQYLFRADPFRVKWNTVALFCGNLGGRLVSCVSGVQQYKDHRIDKFVKSLCPINCQGPSPLFTVSTAYSENCFLRPSWYQSMPETDKEKVVTLMKSGVMDESRDPNLLAFRVNMPENAIVDFKTNAS